MPTSNRAILKALIWLYVQVRRRWQSNETSVFHHLICSLLKVVETPGNQVTPQVLGTSVGPSTFAPMATSCAQRVLRLMLEYPTVIFA